MTDMPELYTPVPCPMPDGTGLPCAEPLLIEWQQAYGLTNADLLGAGSDVHPANAEAGTWQVMCTEGHVILVPGEFDDDDETGQSDEHRTFRAVDGQRLRTVLRALLLGGRRDSGEGKHGA